MARLIGIGHCVQDQLMLLARYPALDSKHLALDRVECGGGPVPTALVAAARQGQTCLFVGQVGDDAPGKTILADLGAAGVDTSACRLVAGARSPLASVWIEQGSGKRTVVLDRGDLQPMDEADLPALDWRSDDLLLLDGKDPVCLPAARKAKAVGARVLLDLGSERGDVAELLAQCDLLVASKTWVMAALPELDLFAAVQALCAKGPAAVAITLGAGGLVQAQQGEKATWFPAWPGSRVVDGTGAGDVFHGILAWAILEGRDWRTALKMATVAAGLACGALGGRAGIPDRDALAAAVESWTQI
ncbi:MAG: hypothetical protein KC518_13430 [Candidatus Cloacimonetes bacterium]|nr:hypothetical protein [Candidatus Cloacimonadota bacterium]